MNGLEALPFLREKSHVVSLVGGGGKTTLLYGMARLCAAEGQRVLVSTTTHIQRPSANYAPDEAVRDALWQAEGGLLQGIGMTLTENITYDQRGWPMENSLMQYKIPTRADVGHIRVEFENSYEPNGPFGAKSIGEVVINTPLPAISDAIYNAIGTRFYELPITPEKVAMAVAEQAGEA